MIVFFVMIVMVLVLHCSRYDFEQFVLDMELDCLLCSIVVELPALELDNLQKNQ